MGSAGRGKFANNSAAVCCLLLVIATATVSTFSSIALVYRGLNCLEYPKGNPEFLHGLFHAVYFSFVTFTTLGLGDIHPSNNLGMALICCEAIIGAFLIALFVVVFARKMMR